MQPLQTITKTGSKPGKTLSVIACIHGNEVCGIKGFEALLPTLTIDAGTVHFIYGNPRAIEQGVRYTEMDLNRAFRASGTEDTLAPNDAASYERGRALEIMPFLDASDALLDIHSSGTPDSTPFIICEPIAFPIAEQLPFSLKSCGWDKLHPGSTDSYMNFRGKIGICVECGHHTDPAAIEKAKEAIVAFLVACGAIENGRSHSADESTGKKAAPVAAQKTIVAKSIYQTKAGFSPTRQYADFEKITRGEIVGFDGDSKVVFPEDGYIIFCRAQDEPFRQAFVVGVDVSI